MDAAGAQERARRAAWPIIDRISRARTAPVELLATVSDSVPEGSGSPSIQQRGSQFRSTAARCRCTAVTDFAERCTSPAVQDAGRDPVHQRGDSRAARRSSDSPFAWTDGAPARPTCGRSARAAVSSWRRVHGLSLRERRTSSSFFSGLSVLPAPGSSGSRPSGCCSSRVQRAADASTRELAVLQAVAGRLPALQREVRALEARCARRRAVDSGREGSAGRPRSLHELASESALDDRALHAQARGARRSTRSGRFSSARGRLSRPRPILRSHATMSRLISVSDLDIRRSSRRPKRTRRRTVWRRRSCSRRDPAPTAPARWRSAMQHRDPRRRRDADCRRLRTAAAQIPVGTRSANPSPATTAAAGAIRSRA